MNDKKKFEAIAVFFSSPQFSFNKFFTKNFIFTSSASFNESFSLVLQHEKNKKFAIAMRKKLQFFSESSAKKSFSSYDKYSGKSLLLCIERSKMNYESLIFLIFLEKDEKLYFFLYTGVDGA